MRSKVGTVAPAAAPATASAVSAVKLDKVEELIRKQVVAKAVRDVAAQQANLKKLTPTPKKPEMHYVSETFVRSAVSKNAPQGLLQAIIEMIVRELLAHFNKPKPVLPVAAAAPPPATGPVTTIAKPV